MKTPIYLLIASTVGIVVFSIAIWLPNLSLITTVITSQTAFVLEKVLFVVSLYGGILTNFTLVSALYTVVIAVFAGVYIALFVYYFKRQRKISQSSVARSSLAGIGGIFSGLLGVGCAACGTILFTSLGTSATAGALLVWLPFGGEEFGILGIVLLAYSVYNLLLKINSPQVCKS